jgi:Pyridine nucleotide-disulphide oxidoreductase
MKIKDSHTYVHHILFSVGAVDDVGHHAVMGSMASGQWRDIIRLIICTCTYFDSDQQDLAFGWHTVIFHLPRKTFSTSSFCLLSPAQTPYVRRKTRRSKTMADRGIKPLSEVVREFDVCIIGGGPAGLAALSAIQEPYSLDWLTAGQVHRAAFHLPACTGRSVAVIDPNLQWMQGWSQNLAALDVQFLRSPTVAHPDLFDRNALLAFAEVHGRQDELIESGCGDLQSLMSLGESQIGLWKLPSVALFEDFCRELTTRLPHHYICGQVVDISNEQGGGPLLEVQLADGSKIRAAAVVVAMGIVGKPIIPRSLAAAPNLVPWEELGKDTSPLKKSSCKKVLVVGGGLTAVQAAQRVVKDRKDVHVTLCSRRQLVERHFDLSIDWFDRRTSNKCMSDFYHQPKADRLALLKGSRGGGSVPGVYMKDLVQMERANRIVRIVGNARYVVMGDADTSMIEFDDGSMEDFDVIILACGVQPDCQSHPLCKKLLDHWPTEVVGGFPCVSEDLEWAKNIYVLGGLGSLNIGPDAANLMGMRRGAQLIANAMECRCWLRQSNVLKNPFDALMEDTSDSESDDDEA